MEERNLRKERVGIVVSDKMDKTVVVAVTEKAKHPLYKKTITKTTRFKSHDEKNGEGLFTIMSERPFPDSRLDFTV